MANYQFKDNRNLVFRQIDQNAEASMEQLKELLQESVQEQMLYGYHTPHGKDGHTEIVDTGAMFDSITADWEKQSQNLYVVNVGVPSDSPAADYVDFVHDGTPKLEARPFITDGVLKAQEKAKDIFETNMPVGFDN